MATILVPPLDQWIDQNGNPLASGTIFTAVPGTLNPKPTYQDANQSVSNTNPVILDAAGRAKIYGSGVFRFVVKDSAGNLVYDALTADSASGGIATGGTSTGTPNAQIINASGFSQQDGQAIEFIAGFTNTGPMTVAPGGGAGIPVLIDTSAGPAPLSGGEVVAANAVLLLYEASRGAFHVVNPTPGSFTGATISNSTISASTIATTRIDLEQGVDPTPTEEGRIAWSTLFDTLKVGSGSGTERFWGGPAPGVIKGCTIANNSVDAANDIDFAPGKCADSTDVFYMSLANMLTKRLDATWAVGNNQGGLFSGSIANGTYHCFIIERPDTGIVDAGFDTSPIAANRPAAYTYYRRVGSIIRASSALLAFIQTGDSFYWNNASPPQDYSGGTRAKSNLTVAVPSGIRVQAIFEGSVAVVTGTCTMSVFDGANPNISQRLTWVNTSGNASFAGIDSIVSQFTNTSAQVQLQVSAGSASLATLGWIDTRGR